jgi:hypothetical protein
VLDLRCLLGFHDYDYFTMTRLDGGTEYHRCCLRCEKSELVWWQDVEPDEDDLGIKVTLPSEQKAAFDLIRDDIKRAGEALKQPSGVTDQEQGRANLLALFGVEKKSAADI